MATSEKTPSAAEQNLVRTAERLGIVLAEHPEHLTALLDQVGPIAPPRARPNAFTPLGQFEAFDLRALEIFLAARSRRMDRRTRD